MESFQLILYGLGSRSEFWYDFQEFGNFMKFLDGKDILLVMLVQLIQ